MSIFNIKLKTKSGNDVKKKETFTVFFRLQYKTNVFTKKKTAEYAYRIMYSGGAIDTKTVLELKDADKVMSIEDLTVKVLLNFCHILTKVSVKKNINPDFILFMSPDFDGKKNKAWQFLRDVFYKPEKVKKVEQEPGYGFLDDLKDDYRQPYESVWNEYQCKGHHIVKAELDMLKEFVDSNPATTFMNIDPSKNPKYAKSLAICSMLQDRLDRKFQEEIEY